MKLFALFVQIKNEIADIVDATTIEQQITDHGWTSLSSGVYYKIIEAKESDQEFIVFDEFKVKTDANVAAYDGYAINVKAYAIQFDGMADATAAWDAVSTAAP